MIISSSFFVLLNMNMTMKQQYVYTNLELS